MPGQATAQTRLDFRILGELEVRVDGGPPESLTAGQRTLLGALLLHANETVSRDELAKALWPDDPATTALRRLTAQVTGLRRRLPGRGTDRPLIESVPGGYVLSAGTDQLDALRFRALSGEGRAALEAGAAEEAAGRLREALALWRGPVLGGTSNGLTGEAAHALENLRGTAVAARIEADLALERERERLRTQADEHLEEQADDAVPNAVAASFEGGDEPEETGPAPDIEAVDDYAVHAGRDRSWLRLLTGAVAALALAAAAVAAFLLLREERPVAATAALRAVPIAVEPNTLVELDPATGKVLGSFAVGAEPEQVTVAQGDVWVLSSGTGTVAQVDLAGGELETVGVLSGVRSLAGSDADGVWISRGESRTLRQLPSDVVGVPRTVPIGRGIAALAVGGGYLWAVNPPTDEDQPDTLSLVDVDTGIVDRRVPIGVDSRFVAYGDGAVWVTSPVDDTLTTIAPTGETETIEVGPGPAGLAVTDDAVWVAHFWTNELWRIDPGTKDVVARIPVGQGPYDVEAGLGAVFVTSVDSRTISRVDPETNRVEATFSLAFPAHGLAIGEDALWATIQACGSPVYAC
jgi:streptogramin lyase